MLSDNDFPILMDFVIVHLNACNSVTFLGDVINGIKEQSPPEVPATVPVSKSQ